MNDAIQNDWKIKTTTTSLSLFVFMILSLHGHTSIKVCLVNSDI